MNVFLLVVLPSEPPRTESSASSRTALPEPNKNNYVIDLLSCKCNIQLLIMRVDEKGILKIDS